MYGRYILSMFFLPKCSSQFNTKVNVNYGCTKRNKLVLAKQHGNGWNARLNASDTNQSWCRVGLSMVEPLVIDSKHLLSSVIMSAGGEKSKSASQTDGKAANNKMSDMGSYKVKYTHAHTQTTLDDQTSTDIPSSLVHTMWCSWLHADWPDVYSHNLLLLKAQWGGGRQLQLTGKYHVKLLCFQSLWRKLS